MTTARADNYSIASGASLYAGEGTPPAAATAVLLDGPTTGTVDVASSNFTVSVNGALAGDVEVTPAAASGTFVPTSVVLSAGASPTPQTFSYTATSEGAKSITLTNDGSLSNPSAWTFTASEAAPAATVSMSLDNESGSSGVRFSGGMGFAQGDIPSGNYLTSADTDSFQGAVLNRWPDNSVKFAIVVGTDTVTPSTTASIEVTGTPTAPGAPVAESVLATAAPNAVITVDGIGSVALTDLIGVASTLSSGRWTAGRVRTLWAGPICSSWLYYSRIAGHAHLSAWFEVRCWSDGAYEILPWLENGWWNVAGPTAFTGTVRFSLGGVEQVSSSLTVYSHQRVALLKTTALPYRVGGTWAEVLHNPAYLQSTDLVPSYHGNVNGSVISAMVQDYTIAGLGSGSSSMGSGGYSPTLGLLPEWDAIYVSSADRRARRCTMVNGFTDGRWTTHYRDETTNFPVAPAAYPSWVLNNSSGQSGLTDISASATGSYTPVITGTGPSYYFAYSHHHSSGYMAYLASGWNYLIEETQFVSGICCYRMHSTHRQDGKHLFRGDVTGATRGVAWSTRTVAQAATLTPDADALRTALVGVVNDNIDFNHATYVAQENNQFGFMAEQDAYTPAAYGTSLAGGTSTMISLGQTAVPSAGKYVDWFLTIGGEERVVTVFPGGTSAVALASGFTVGVTGVAWTADPPTGQTGTSAAGGTSTSVLLGAGAPSADNYYAGWTLTIGGEAKVIAAYVGSTRQAIMAEAFTVGTSSVTWTATTTQRTGTATLANSTASLVFLGDVTPQPYDNRFLDWTITIGGEARVVTASTRTAVATVGVPFTVGTSGAAWTLVDKILAIPAWMHDFMTASLGYQLALQPMEGAHLTKMQEFFQWKGRSAVGRLGVPGVATEYAFQDAGVYEMAGFPADAPDFNGGTGPWYANWGEIYTATWKAPNTALPTDPLRGGSIPIPTGTWANFLPAMAYAVQHRVPGADVGYARVTSASNWASVLTNGQQYPVWMVKPKAEVKPAWVTPVGTVASASLNTVMDINPGTTVSREGDFSQAGLSELFIAWGGCAWMEHKSRAYFIGNGHGSGCANDVVEYDFYTRLFSIIKSRAPWSVVHGTAGARTWQTDSTTTVIALQPNVSSATNDAYVGWTIQIGTETRTVTSYEGGLVRRATVDTPFSSAPVKQPYLLTNGSTTIGMLAQAGTTTTSVVLPASAASQTNFYYTWRMEANGVQSIITYYDGPTRTATLSTALAGAVEGRPVSLDSMTGYVADPVTGWHWTDKKGIAVDVGEPFGPHSYGWLLTMPPHALTPTGPANTAVDGYFVLPGNTTMPLGGGVGTGQTAALKIGDSKFTAVGATFPNDPNHACSIYDDVRHRLIQFTDSNSATKNALDVVAGTVGTINLGAVYYAYSAVSAKMERHDLYTAIAMQSSGEPTPFRFMVSDPQNSTMLSVTYAGTAPTLNPTGGHHFACCWIEPWQAWACYPANGSNTIYFLKAPANPRTSSVWTWSSQTFTGTALSNFVSSNNPPYTRLRAVREHMTETGILLWFPLVGQPAQQIHVTRP